MRQAIPGHPSMKEGMAAGLAGGLPHGDGLVVLGAPIVDCEHEFESMTLRERSHHVQVQVSKPLVRYGEFAHLLRFSAVLKLRLPQTVAIFVQKEWKYRIVVKKGKTFSLVMILTGLVILLDLQNKKSVYHLKKDAVFRIPVSDHMPHILRLTESNVI